MLKVGTVGVMKRFFGSATEMPKKVAVILSGCGVYDGTEIHEASATLVHLTKLNYEPLCFAPDKPQLHAIDHTKGVELPEQRNVLIESARIARGNIRPLSSLQASEVAAAIFPGGFGAAKNLSNFATEGTNIQVDPQVADVVKNLLSSKRPLGFICISPILAAKLIPGVQITLGQESGDKWPHAGAIEAARALGANVKCVNVDQVCVDEANGVVSTPAFMFDGQFHQIFDGIGNLVSAVDKLIKNR